MRAVTDAELDEARSVLGWLWEYRPQGEGLDGVDGGEFVEEEPAD